MKKIEIKHGILQEKLSGTIEQIIICKNGVIRMRKNHKKKKLDNAK